MQLAENATILFQGDSITDAGRRDAPDGLGSGYVSMIRALLTAKSRSHRFHIINRGIGGDRTVELLTRWQEDCLAIKPDLLSLMIGVNDVWRLGGKWQGQTFVPFEEYCANVRSLLAQAGAAGVQYFALMSPSAISDNNDPTFATHLDQRAEFIKSLAAELGAIYVPIREAQKQALHLYPEVKWTTDGCHPTAAGHALFAQTWLDAVAPIL